MLNVMILLVHFFMKGHYIQIHTSCHHPVPRREDTLAWREFLHIQKLAVLFM